MNLIEHLALVTGRRAVCCSTYRTARLVLFPDAHVSVLGGKKAADLWIGLPEPARSPRGFTPPGQGQSLTGICRRSRLTMTKGIRRSLCPRVQNGVGTEFPQGICPKYSVRTQVREWPVGQLQPLDAMRNVPPSALDDSTDDA